MSKPRTMKYTNTLKTFKTLWNIYSPRIRKLYVLLSLVCLITACVGTLFAISSVPFFNGLTNIPKSDISNNSHLLNSIKTNILIFGSLGLSGACLRSFKLWLTTSLCSLASVEFAKYTYSKSLGSSYEFIDSVENNEFITLYTKNSDAASVAIFNLTNHFASSIEALVLVVSILYVSFDKSIISIILLACTYFYLNRFISKQINSYAIRVKKSTHEITEVIRDSKECIKEIIINNEMSYIEKKYTNFSSKLRFGIAFSQYLSSLPKSLIEASGFIAITLLLYFSIITDFSSFTKTLSMISFYLVAGYKVLPAVQSSFYAYSIFLGHEPQLKELLRFSIKAEKASRSVNPWATFTTNTSFIETSKQNKYTFCSLNIINLYHSYGEKKVLENFNLTIYENEKIAIIGPSGSGKSTCLNILLGLTKPDSAEFHLTLRCGNQIKQLPSENYFNQVWFRNLTYVPQKIYVKSLSIEQLITNNSLDIDYQLLNFALESAMLSELVYSLPMKEKTVISNHGGNFSGGQIQRLAIAKAIYNSNEIIILDEFTSALDNNASLAIFDNIKSLKKTVIFTTHNSLIYREADKIVTL